MIDYERFNEIYRRLEDQDTINSFDQVENKLSSRPDLHAFLLLDKLVQGTMDMVSSAEHDIIYLDTNVEDFCKVATEDDLLQLIRCGVMYENEYECFSMYV